MSKLLIYRLLPALGVATLALPLSAFAQVVPLSQVSAIQSNGHIAINLVQVKSPQAAEMVISAAAKKRIKYRIRRHKLILNDRGAYRPKQGLARVTIKIFRLRQIEALNDTAVTGDQLHSQGFDLVFDDRADVNLNGDITVDAILARGPGKINMNWINSKQLSISAGGGVKIKLAGVVKSLRAKLSQHAHLNAQYLRADRVWVGTRGFSSAYVLPIDSLQAFASGYSNIYYFKQPRVISHTTSESGNILQAGWQA